MPIHDQGYRRYAGRRAPSGRAWWVIARMGLANLLRQRQFMALLMLSWAPFLVRAVQIYVASSFQQAGFLATTPQTFRDFLGQQDLFVFFVTIYAGAGLIADDRRTNALQLYLSRPLTRTEYVAGKMATLLACLLAVSWVPAVLLLVFDLLCASDTAMVGRDLRLIPPVTLLAFLQVLVASFAMLALSSVSRSRRFVAVLYAGVMFFTAALHAAVRATTGRSLLAWLSPYTSLEIVGDAIFGLPSAHDFPVALAALALAVMLGVSAIVLQRHVRGVEVVT